MNAVTETRRRCSIGALMAQGPALVGLLLSLALTTGCKPSDKQGRTSESLEAEGTSGTGLSAIRFQTSGLYTSVDLDEHWMLLLLEAVDRDGPAGDVVSRTLGGTASRPSNWMGTVWTIDGWVAASLTSTPVPGVGSGADFATGEFRERRWVNVDTSDVDVWRDGDPDVDLGWRVRFATLEESWRFALDPEIGLVRFVSRQAWNGAPLSLREVDVSGSLPAGFERVYFGEASTLTQFGRSNAWLAWAESGRTPGKRVWVAAWGLAGKGNYRLVVGCSAPALEPELENPDPSRVESLYPTPVNARYH